MPIYQYKCRSCGEISELMLPIEQKDAMIICNSCNNSEMERQVSAPGLIKSGANAPGTTCCGRNERCETPACSTGDGCRRA